MPMKKLSLALSLCLLLFAPAGSHAASAQQGKALDAASVDAMATFGETLFTVVQKDAKPNLVLSPLSAYVALSLAATGAAGETAAAFEAVLGLNAEEAAKACRALMASLASSQGGAKLFLHNALWMDDEIGVRGTFIAAAKDRFAAEVFSQDLQDPAAVSDVNAWVSERTRGLIPALLDKIDQNAVLLLLNTLYMDAAWKEPFNPLFNAELPFRLADGTEVRTTFMSTDHGVRRVLQTEDAEGVLLPYSGGTLGFLAVKPRSGEIADLSLNGTTLSAWLGALSERESVSVTLPKFTSASEVTMNDALIAMGLGDAFSPGKADFSGIGRSEKGNVCIGRVLQKVMMRVHEKGTEAAAATAVEMIAMAAYMPDPYEIVFDSPFVYAVVDLSSGLPLFLGVMDEPAP